MNDEHEQEPTGYVFRGNVQTGAVGTGASATVGAIGDRARGWVTVARHPDQERLLAQMLALVDDLRDALAEHRETVGEDYEAIRDNIDDLEESLEEMKPTGRIRSKLKAMEQLVSPFSALASLVAKLLELIHKSES